MARSRVVVVAILAAASVGGWWSGRARTTADRPALVVRALDGDTVEVRLPGGGADTVRLLGVDTPETHHPSRPVECFGPEAARFTRRALEGRHVTLEDDVERRDRYGRRLAYVHVDGRRFNDELLRLGYARLLVIAPNGAHARTMLREELDARRARRGLWGACG